MPEIIDRGGRFRRIRIRKYISSGVFLVVFFTFFAWALRVAFLNFDTLSDLTLAGALNEASRFAIFVGPVIVYLRYVERAPTLAFLKIKRPHANSAWVLPVTGALFVCWYLLLNGILEDGRAASAGFASILFTILSPATLAEEVYFWGFLLNKFRQGTSFWRANLFSSLLFVLIHFPGWFALDRFSTLLVLTDATDIFVFGLVFGWALKKTGSLWSAYFLHALHNLLIVAVYSA